MTEANTAQLLVPNPRPASTTGTTMSFTDIVDGVSQYDFEEWKEPIAVLEVITFIPEDEAEDNVEVELAVSTKETAEAPAEEVEGLEVDRATEGPTVKFTLVNPVVFDQGVKITVTLTRRSLGQPRPVDIVIVACVKTGETFDGSDFVEACECHYHNAYRSLSVKILLITDEGSLKNKAVV